MNSGSAAGIGTAKPVTSATVGSKLASTSTVTEVPSSAGLTSALNLTAQDTILLQNKVKKEVTWSKILPQGKFNEDHDYKLDPVLFSDAIKRVGVDVHPTSGLMVLCSRFHGPSIKDVRYAVLHLFSLGKILSSIRHLFNYKLLNYNYL